MPAGIRIGGDGSEERHPATLLPEEPHEFVHHPHVLGEAQEIGEDVVRELQDVPEGLVPPLPFHLAGQIDPLHLGPRVIASPSFFWR